MDQRLQYIAENFDDMRIGIDESFQFHCDQCGKCCINREDILLNLKDLYNIAKHLGLTPEEVVEKYGETYLGGSSRLPIVRLKPRGSIKRCPLLKDRKCSVHQAKPTVCAMYPIGRCIRIETDQYNAANIDEVQIEYIFSRVDCGDNSESHTVREWLDAFGIPARDESFIRWQQAIAAVGSRLRKMEPVTPDRCMELVWTLVYSALYLSYDMEKDFDDQFRANAAKLIDALDHLPPVLEVRGNE